MGSITDTILAGNPTTKQQPSVNLATPPNSGPGSGYQKDVAAAIAAKPDNPYVPGPCNQNSLAANQLPPVTVALPFLAQGTLNLFDILVTLPTPSRKIIIASEGQSAYATQLFLSLVRTGLSSPNDVQYVPLGTEPWIVIRDFEGDSSGFQGVSGTIIEFRNPVSQFYLSATSGNEENYNITFLCADDLVAITWRPGGSGN